MTNFEHLAEGPTTEEMTRRGKKLTWLRPKSFWGTWKAHEQRRGSNPMRLAFKSHASAKRPSCSTSGMTVSESASGTIQGGPLLRYNPDTSWPLNFQPDLLGSLSIRGQIALFATYIYLIFPRYIVDLLYHRLPRLS